MSKVLHVSYENEQTCDDTADGYGFSEAYGEFDGDGGAIDDYMTGYGDGSPPEALPPRGDGSGGCPDGEENASPF